MQRFNYVNTNGYNKMICVYPERKNENGEYYAEIWTGQNDTMEATGMFCGSGYMSKEKMKEFFAHYNINYNVDDIE